ncbi:MAG: hypothetical protein PPP56_06885 [Longimonas sp.]|uniref:hypothetical protein n=1 Tax=Longimonas sp. TaxID=2039626 RepID=UPI003354B14F
MHVLFIALVGPILFFLLTWVLATAYRLYFPEKPLSFEGDSIVLWDERAHEEKSVPVGAQDIRERQRRSQYLRKTSPDYRYAWGDSDGFPEAWRENIRMRRN